MLISVNILINQLTDSFSSITNFITSSLQITNVILSSYLTAIWQLLASTNVLFAEVSRQFRTKHLITTRKGFSFTCPSSQTRVADARAERGQRFAEGHCGRVSSFLDTGAWSLAFPLTNLWPKNPWIIWITSGVFFWQKAAPLANVRENYCDRPSGSFYVSAREPSSSSAYKADLRYYGKSNKYRWNWRYAAGLLWPNIVFGSLRYF